MTQHYHQHPVTTRFRMLKELIRSKADKKIIAVWSEKLENLLQLCTVEDVRTDEDEGEVVVILRQASGPKRQDDTLILFLHEIGQINTFDKTFPESK